VHPVTKRQVRPARAVDAEPGRTIEPVGVTVGGSHSYQRRITLGDLDFADAHVLHGVPVLGGLDGRVEAKDLVDGAPSVVKAGVTKDEAATMKGKLEEQGAAVEVK